MISIMASLVEQLSRVKADKLRSMLQLTKVCIKTFHKDAAVQGGRHAQKHRIIIRILYII